MTSSEVAQLAPRDTKALECSSKEEIKASAISGNDEPTNSSSAESHHPSITINKALKLPTSASGHEEAAEKASEYHPNDIKGGSPGVSFTSTTDSKLLGIVNLRKIARKPGTR